jgi:hypothetical protein
LLLTLPKRAGEYEPDFAPGPVLGHSGEELLPGLPLVSSRERIFQTGSPVAFFFSG